MPTVSMREAKTNLSELVEAVETGKQSEVVIARNGRAVARLVPVRPAEGQRIGVANGAFFAPENIDAANAEIDALFIDQDK